jgi:LysM repeat protein
VVKGDSLYKIASDHGISLDALRKANPNVEPRKMKVGQVLQIPAAPPATATAPANAERPIEGAEQTYTVKAGDTLTKIAKIHKTTIEALKEANNLKTDRLKVGQKLKIPPPKTTNAPANPASGPTSGAPRGAQLADTNPVWTAVIGRC